MTSPSVDLFRLWWYYTVELAPNQIAKGIFPDDLPLLPRMLLRHCDLSGMECLDIGSMEGLIPVIMRRRGARRVVASDAEDHCTLKMAAIQQAYQVQFDYWRFQTLYNLSGQCPLKSFDLINLSGVLYHVFSPLLVLAGIRPLLKHNGLLIVSTGVVEHDGFFMEFNAAGRFQEDANTFWYVSIPALDYMLRYFRLCAIDCLYLPHRAIQSKVHLPIDKPTGYLSIVCRAVNNSLADPSDTWMGQSMRASWEYLKLVNWPLQQGQQPSSIAYQAPLEPRLTRPGTGCLDLWLAAKEKQCATAARSCDAHTLRLSDQE